MGLERLLYRFLVVYLGHASIHEGLGEYFSRRLVPGRVAGGVEI